VSGLKDNPRVAAFLARDSEPTASEQAQDDGRVAGRLPSPDNPWAVAAQFVLGRWTREYDLTLRHFHGEWWRWKGPRWRRVDEKEVRDAASEFTADAHYMKPKGTPKQGEQRQFEATDWKPNRRKIADLLEALAARAGTDEELDQPCWLDGRTDDHRVIVSCANGLLALPERRLTEHTPRFFNVADVPFDYDPDVPTPERWLRFLDELWPQDEESIALPQEWFGYVISGRTNLHAILLLVGPGRAGKGTIAWTLSRLLGRTSPGKTLEQLGDRFGLQDLIGEPLAVFPDVRIASRADARAVVARLLSISGEDPLSIDRKNRSWTRT
jgi:putative DNA primase/helicase